jgi:TrpR-related protein YerC/YecD
MPQKNQGRYINNLYGAILKLNNLDEAKRFFRDLLTEQEILEFSRRWQTARMLDAKRPYSEIEEETGLSSATVARISKWLNQGRGGYRLALDKMHHHNSSFEKRL